MPENSESWDVYGSQNYFGMPLCKVGKLDTLSLFNPILVVDGPIGSGKTTLINRLKEKLHCLTHTEDVSSWRDFVGENLLLNYYNNPDPSSPWAFRFHVKVITDICKSDHSARGLQRAGEAIVQERDINSVTSVFLPSNEEHFHPVDYKLLLELAGAVDDHAPYKKRIVLGVDADVGFRRMVQRGRPEENNFTSERYQDHIEAYKRMERDADLVLDTSRLTEEEVEEAVLEFIQRVPVEAHRP